MGDGQWAMVSQRGLLPLGEASAKVAEVPSVVAPAVVSPMSDCEPRSRSVSKRRGQWALGIKQVL
jgi:hypothetical protein